MSQNNKPAQSGKNGPGLTKLEEASLRLLSSKMAGGYEVDVKAIVELASYTLKATSHFANNGSFDTFED